MLFRSAGFLRSDEPSPADMVTALGEHGIDASQHRSYQLDDASLAVADLLLTMEGQHVQKATVIRPDAFAKIVPISEANELLARWGPMSIEDFLTHLNRDRDPRSYLDNRWDVSDPYGRRMKAYRKAVEEIDGLVARVIGSLA